MTFSIAAEVCDEHFRKPTDFIKKMCISLYRHVIKKKVFQVETFFSCIFVLFLEYHKSVNTPISFHCCVWPKFGIVSREKHGSISYFGNYSRLCVKNALLEPPQRCFRNNKKI